MEDSERKLKLTQRIAFNLCQKLVKCDSSQIFTQDKKFIYYNSSWIEAIHEIAHWMASDPRFREEPNLGLPTHQYSTNEISLIVLNGPTEAESRMFYEETLACFLTYHICERINRFIKLTELEQGFAIHVYQSGENLCRTCKLNPDIQKEKALEIFKSFRETIDWSTEEAF